VAELALERRIRTEGGDLMRALATTLLAFALLPPAGARAESVLVQPGPEGEDNAPYAFIPSLIRNTNTTAYAFSSTVDGVKHDFQYFLEFDVAPFGGTVQYAYAYFYYGFGFDGFGNESPNPGAGEIHCHNVLAPWTENTLNWNNRPAVSPALYVFPNITGFGHFFCKMTATVQGWVDGSIANHGMALTSPSRRLVGMFTFEASPTLTEVPNGLTAADLKPSLLIRFVETSASDIDRDGVRDRSDNCAGRANAAQDDWDGDRVGDACDVCPAISDRTQRDRDGDGRGDRCGAKAVDLDRNGAVDAADAALAAELVSGRSRKPALRKKLDTNRDGRVDQNDLDRWLSVYEPLLTLP
jgi:hypothetical protein